MLGAIDGHCLQKLVALACNHHHLFPTDLVQLDRYPFAPVGPAGKLTNSVSALVQGTCSGFYAMLV